MKSLHKACSKGKSSSHTKQTMLQDYLLPNFQATTLQGLLCILLLTCPFGILPAPLSWGEKGLVPVCRVTPAGAISVNSSTDVFGGKENPFISFPRLQLTWFLCLQTISNLCCSLKKEMGQSVLWQVQCQTAWKYLESVRKSGEIVCYNKASFFCVHFQPRLGCLTGRPSKGWVNSFGMNKRLSPRTVVQVTFFQHAGCED